jgi:sugar phosphate permease
VVLPEIIKDLELSRTAGGSIFNAYLFVYICLTPLTGYLTDRLGARNIITACAFILAAGLFSMGMSRCFMAVVLSYGLVGLGATGMWTPVITVVQRWFAPKRRGLALGILSTGYGLGFATMGAVFPWIVDNFTWRHAWYFLSAGALAMVFLNRGFLRSSPESSGARPWGMTEPPEPSAAKEKGPQVKLAQVFRHRNFWLIGLSYFFISYSLYGITTFMVDYAEGQLGLPLEKASLLATVHGFSQVIGVLTILPLSDYLGRKRTILISNSMIAASLVGIMLSNASWQFLYLFVGVLAVFYGVTFPIYGASAGDFFPRKYMGSVIGMWTPFYGLGAIVVHWVTGMLRDVTGSYDSAFMISTAVAVLSVVLMSFVSKPVSD